MDNAIPNFDEFIDRRGTYCTQWDYVADRFGQENLLPFTVSDTDFTVPHEITQAIKKRLEHEVFGYTRWNHSAFKQSICRWYQQQFHTTINEEWILYSPSVIYSISKLIELNSEIGDHVVIQTPAYDAFFKTIHENQREIVENPLIYKNYSYTIDFEDLEKKLAHPRCKVLLFCSPHNPTGRLWTENELRTIISLCKKYSVFLISDEIHMDIIRKGMTHLPVLMGGDMNGIALCTSASKTFNTPGLVSSYLLIPDEKLRERFLLTLKNRDGLSSTSIFGMISTMTAYNECADWVEKLNDYLDENIRLTISYLAEHLPEFTVVQPEAMYLIWIDCSQSPFTMDELQQAMITQGQVAIMDGATYGTAGENFLRLNVGCSKEKLLDGLARMKTSIDYLKNKQQ